MAATIAGGSILSGILNVIAQSLLIPVMILLVIFIIFAVIEIGALLAEYTSRVKLSAHDIDKLIKKIATSDNMDEVRKIIKTSKLNDSDKKLLIEISETDQYNNKTVKEAIATNLLEDQEFRVYKSLEKTDIVAKVGSACGLLGTIIPMGPGLAALGTGDIQTLTQNLTIAFNTTTAGLAASSVCYVVAKIRRRWYEEEISNLYSLADVIIEVK